MNVLAIGAHFDDVELGCGGALARHVAKGDKVVVYVATVSGFSNHRNSEVRSNEVAQAEGEAAMRLLTRHQAGYQPRLVARLEELLAEEVDCGRLELPADVHEVAYVLEQLVESYVYLLPIAGEEPDARRAEPILRMLLR